MSSFNKQGMIATMVAIYFKFVQLRGYYSVANCDALPLILSTEYAVLSIQYVVLLIICCFIYTV